MGGPPASYAEGMGGPPAELRRRDGGPSLRRRVSPAAPLPLPPVRGGKIQMGGPCQAAPKGPLPLPPVPRGEDTDGGSPCQAAPKGPLPLPPVPRGEDTDGGSPCQAAPKGWRSFPPTPRRAPILTFPHRAGGRERRKLPLPPVRGGKIQMGGSPVRGELVEPWTAHRPGLTTPSVLVHSRHTFFYVGDRI